MTKTAPKTAPKTATGAAAGGAGKQKAKTAETPWGRATVVEHVSIPQRAGDKRFASVVELLETRAGERLVRIAYTTDGHVRRGPVTMRLRDLERVRAGVARTTGLREALGREGA
jgi:hypothetical protein